MGNEKCTKSDEEILGRFRTWEVGNIKMASNGTVQVGVMRICWLSERLLATEVEPSTVELFIRWDRFREIPDSEFGQKWFSLRWTLMKPVKFFGRISKSLRERHAPAYLFYISNSNLFFSQWSPSTVGILYRLMARQKLKRPKYKCGN
jgi:hypothetical protein